MAVAAAVRTNWARVILNLRRMRSVSAFASSMIRSCAFVGGSGKYSSFEQGMTSTGRSSDMSFQECRFGPEFGAGQLRVNSLTS